MNISDSIKFIYPNLKFDKDFIVEDRLGLQNLIWYNKEVEQPTQSELQTAWIEVEKQQKTEILKKECSEIILAKYPYYSQINMGAEIQEIHLNSRNEDRTFTDEEMLKVGEASEMKNWIDEMRKECNKKISEL